MRLDEEKLFSYLCPFSTAALLLAQSFNMFLLWPLFPSITMTYLSVTRTSMTSRSSERNAAG